MAEDMIRTAGRRKRTGWLRRCNVWLLVITTVALAALCAAMFVRIQEMDRAMDSLTAQVGELSKVVLRQRVQMGHLAEELQAVRGEAGTVGDQEPVGQGTEKGEGAGGDVRETAAQVTAEHKVYLTFDDGPSNHTQDILDVLDDYGVKATFFVIGKEGDFAEEALKRIVKDGHTLGLHSYTHKYAELYASIENFAEDFAKLRDYLDEITGVKSVVYRFPGGSSNTVKSRTIDMAEFARYLDGEGVRFFDWNISAGDGGSEVLPVKTVVENCTANISKYSTSIILMHDTDIKVTTLEALPAIIEAIQAMEDTVILPITEDTKPVQHIKWQE